MSGPAVLIIEDTPTLRHIYQAALRSSGFSSVMEGTAAAGLRTFAQIRPRVVLLDLVLPDGDGLEVMTQMLEIAPRTRVIVITSDNSIKKAVAAMRGGAYEYLVKPIDETRLLGAVRNAFRTISQEESLDPEVDSAELVGSSAVMQDIRARVSAVASSMATVFITGQSGTGKKLCARAVHRASNRAAGPFVSVSCGAIPADQLQSEMFGHLKDAVPGAPSDKSGALAAANGGTVFLNDVCQMDPKLQTMLLRFLETSEILPIGASSPRKVNVRLICASASDPLLAVRRGQFREDLFYRLHVVPIEMPPLCARGNDVVEIAQIALRRLARDEGRGFTSISDEAADFFRRLRWPGNVQQLLNVLHHVVVMNDGVEITKQMLPAALHHLQDDRIGAPPHAGAPPVTAAPRPREMETLIGKPLAQIERLVIEETIARQGGSVTRAARVLKVSPSTLYRKIETWRQRSSPK